MLKNRVDNNQKEICAALRVKGLSVLFLQNVKFGCPDVLVGHNGQNYLFEIKSNKRAKLTEQQKTFHFAWKGQANVVYSLEDIYDIIGIKE